MTSVHAYTQPQSNSNSTPLNQTIQSPNNFNEAERVHHRMDELRKHHNESEEIYNRTQPIINEQIHVETMKYLKTNQVSGTTKPKSQKPRAQRKPKNFSANNTSNNNTGVNNNNSTLAQPINTASIVTNELPLHQSQMQPIPSQSQPNPHMQQTTVYTPHVVQQQSMHIQLKQTQPMQNQQQQQQQHFKYRPSNNVYHQQSPQSTLQVQKQYQDSQQQMYSQQPQQHIHQQTQPHIHNQPKEQSQYVVQQQPVQNHQHLNGTHLASNNHSHPQQYGYTTSYAPTTSSHNDLDLTLQAGLECDVDSLIRHEMSVEGRLEFNHDLLLKLDNHHHPYHQ